MSDIQMQSCKVFDTHFPINRGHIEDHGSHLRLDTCNQRSFHYHIILQEDSVVQDTTLGILVQCFIPMMASNDTFDVSSGKDPQ